MKLSTSLLLFSLSILIFACQHDHKSHEGSHDRKPLEGSHDHKEINDHDVHHGIHRDHKKDNDVKPALIHTVFFWAKEGSTAEELKSFEQGLIKLGTCPQIQSYYWGPPAPTENRDVVDNTYDYAINIHFASVEDQKGYQDEPIHQEFIENHQDLWGKVVVYDNVVR